MSVEGLLFSKYLMYRSVYWHKGVRSATAMIKKAVLLALERGSPRERGPLRPRRRRLLREARAIPSRPSPSPRRSSRAGPSRASSTCPSTSAKESHRAPPRSGREAADRGGSGGEGRARHPRPRHRPPRGRLLRDRPSGPPRGSAARGDKRPALPFAESPTVFSPPVVAGFARSLRRLRSSPAKLGPARKGGSRDALPERCRQGAADSASARGRCAKSPRMDTLECEEGGMMDIRNVMEDAVKAVVEELFEREDRGKAPGLLHLRPMQARRGLLRPQSGQARIHRLEPGTRLQREGRPRQGPAPGRPHLPRQGRLGQGLARPAAHLRPCAAKGSGERARGPVFNFPDDHGQGLRRQDLRSPGRRRGPALLRGRRGRHGRSQLAESLRPSGRHGGDLHLLAQARSRPRPQEGERKFAFEIKVEVPGLRPGCLTISRWMSAPSGASAWISPCSGCTRSPTSISSPRVRTRRTSRRPARRRAPVPHNG